MKKIGIVSCYYINNYGSIIQSYAMQKILNQLDIPNETINVEGFIKDLRKKQYIYILKSGVLSEIFLDKFGKARNIIIKRILKNDYTRNILIRENAMKRFINEKICLSDVYSSIKELSKKSVEQYNAVLLGSDQLWLPSNISADYYTLSFVPRGVNTVAYATSFGVSSLPQNVTDTAKDFLKRIRHVSVREQAGSELIEKLIGRKVPVVCDPTLLFTRTQWDELKPINHVTEGEYIFCYFIGECKLHRDFSVRLKKETKLRIVSLIHLDYYMKSDEGYADETPFDVGPAEFIDLIRNAKYICTDSFHCTVFSILYNKTFFCFKRYVNSSSQSTNSRLNTLLDATDLANRMFTGEEQINRCLSLKIDYNLVNKKIDDYRKMSLEYLVKALKNEESTDIL